MITAQIQHINPTNKDFCNTIIYLSFARYNMGDCATKSATLADNLNRLPTLPIIVLRNEYNFVTKEAHIYCYCQCSDKELQVLSDSFNECCIEAFGCAPEKGEWKEIADCMFGDLFVEA